jgi:subtilisin family serine protease
VANLHRCFADVYEIRNGLRIARGLLEDPDLDPDMEPTRRDELLEQHQQAALTDEFGHGTHVAGIIAGRAPLDETIEIYALERQQRSHETGNGVTMEFNRRPVVDRNRLRGVAPACRLVSLRVLDDQGNGRTSNVIRALEYIRERINDDPKLFRVHGVNLSVGYEFDAEMFACGQSPLCTEVDRLVQAGVMVIAAAGNTGYGTRSADVRATKGGLATTINDPGNAALAITVGATHRDAPHTYGVSYFSSKGPTGDGRLKPDLVAPGERITSCAAGKKLQDTRLKKGSPSQANKISYYVDDSGTSMAAPHVSGAIASFLSIRREFIGKPLEVKEIFLKSATSLGRERYFEGYGLVDLMRAIQSV